MKALIVNRLSQFLDKLISYDGIDKETLRYKKTYLSAAAVVTFFVIGMTALVIYLKIKGFKFPC